MNAPSALMNRVLNLKKKSQKAYATIIAPQGTRTHLVSQTLRNANRHTNQTRNVEQNGLGNRTKGRTPKEPGLANLSLEI